MAAATVVGGDKRWRWEAVGGGDSGGGRLRRETGLSPLFRREDRESDLGISIGGLEGFKPGMDSRGNGLQAYVRRSSWLGKVTGVERGPGREVPGETGGRRWGFRRFRGFQVPGSQRRFDGGRGRPRPGIGGGGEAVTRAGVSRRGVFQRRVPRVRVRLRFRKR